MAVESMNGLTVEDMMVSGKIITCTVKEFTPGKMVESTMEIISTTESMAKESTPGRMADNI